MKLNKKQTEILRNEASFLRLKDKSVRADYQRGVIFAPKLTNAKIKQINTYYKKSPFPNNRFLRVTNKK